MKGVAIVLLGTLQLCTRADWTSLATYEYYRKGKSSSNAGPVNLEDSLSRNYRESEDSNREQICNAPGLTPSQKQMCVQYPEETRYLQLGSRLGKQECEQQMRDATWNCPTKIASTGIAFRTKRNTKEQSFGTAIMAAAGMKMLATACARGEIERCKCSTTECAAKGIEFGYQWSKQFINTEFSEAGPELPEKLESSSRKKPTSLRKRARRKEEQRLLNLYNGEVGRVIAKNSAKVTCRCHGVSGTCSSKTCSNKIDKFNAVAKNLVQSYERAQRVRLNPRTKELVHRKNKNVVFVNQYGEIKYNPRAKDGAVPRLLYTRKPIDWCSLDGKGRYFNANRPCRTDLPDNEDTSCQRLCCGYGYFKNIRTVRKKCKCRLGPSWDQLICETCEETIEEHLCRGVEANLQPNL